VDFATGNGLSGSLAQAKLSCTNPFGQTSLFLNETMTDADGRYLVNYPVDGGSSCPNQGRGFSISKMDYTFIGRIGPPGHNDFVAVSDNLPRLSQVSAASFFPPAASEMITAGFGTGLAATMEVATTLPLPTRLAGRVVKVADFRGTEKLAQMLFISPNQVNFIMPEGLDTGPAIIGLVGDNGLVSVGVTHIQIVSPGLFAANANGRGLAAAVILRKRANGTEQYEPVAQYSEAQKQWIPLPIDLGPDSDRIILALFGTGWRHIGDPSNVTVELRPLVDEGLPSAVRRPAVLYAGPQPTIAGLDQINIELPRDLVGKGEINIGVMMKSLPDTGFLHLLNTVRIVVR
jgi:uncharacterized protein (TIGR03437 family)